MQVYKTEEGKRDSLVKSAFSLTLSIITVKIIGFIYKVPLSHILGDEGMGYFNSAYTVFTFFYMLCSGGVPRAVSIVVTEFESKGCKEASERILSLCLKIFICIGAIFTVSLMVFSDFFASLIGSSLSSMSLFVIAPSLTFVAASGVIRGYLNGKGKMVPIAIAEIAEGVIKFIFGLAFALAAAYLEFDFYMISAATLLGVTLGSFVGSLILYICSKKLKTKNNTEQKYKNEISNKEIINKIIKIAIPITLSSAIMGISNIFDLGVIIRRLVTSGISEKEAVALYGNFTTLAVPLLNLVSALISPICASALPHLAYASASKEGERFATLTSQLISFISLIVLPISVAYFFFSEEILILLFKDDSARIAAPLLSLLSPSVIFLPILTIVNTSLEATARPGLSLLSMSFGAVVKLISVYILIGCIGVLGAPVSTSLSYGISLLLSVFFVKKLCGIGFSVYRAFIAPSLFSLASVGMAKVLYLRLSGGHYSAFLFVAFGALSALMYLMLIGLFMKKTTKNLIYFVKMNKKSKKAL